MKNVEHRALSLNLFHISSGKPRLRLIRRYEHTPNHADATLYL